jgi:prepilin-type N-terminal cleavage/methylation domain-containing protein/prepilin-type processing-associated H-X9-DG protein
MHQNRKAAFTLIELLVVIAIIAVIAAILFPVFARAREKARQAACLSNEKQIAHAVRLYMDDYDGAFPFVLAASANSAWSIVNMGDGGKKPVVPGVTGLEPQFQLVTVVAPYVKNQSVWYCPSVGPDYVWQAAIDAGVWKKGMTMRTQGTSYWYTYLAWPNPYVFQQAKFMGGKSDAILLEPSRWPMVSDSPQGFPYTGSLVDPPSSVVPHSAGLNVAYGDGHAKYVRLEVADGGNYLAHHTGDGIYPGQ